MLIEYYTCFTAQAFVANPAAGGPALNISQTITGSNSITSTNDINCKANPFRDLAAGPRSLYVVIGVSTAFAGAGSGSVACNLQQSANAGAGPYTFLEQLCIIPALSAPPVTLTGPQTAFVANQIQPYLITQQYLSIQFVISGAVLTAGAVYAFITPDPTLAFNYPVNYTVATK